jgi:hypothetical protein
MRAAGGMGAYGVSDPNVYPGGVSPLGAPYNERTLFNGNPEPHNPSPTGVMEVHQVGNVNGPCAPYAFNGLNASKQIIGANEARSYLLIQNLSAFANMYVNFGYDAAIGGSLLLAPGVGYTWDTFCPIQNVYIIFDSAGVIQPGFALEGTDQ